MANAITDENGGKGLTCALNTDGVTIVRVKVNPTTHGIKNSDGTSGSDHGVAHAVRDENGNPVWLGVSSADGITPVEIYSDSSGNLLIQSS